MLIVELIFCDNERLLLTYFFKKMILILFQKSLNKLFLDS